MPEGDTIHNTARRLGDVLAGAVVTGVSGSHRAVRADGRRLEGRRIETVRAVGKHLVVDFEHDWCLRTHLGMSGAWHLYAPGRPWRRTPGAARVVLATPNHVAVCFGAPTVQIAPLPMVEAAVGHLGPDLTAASVDWGEIERRAASADLDRTMADLLLDQTLFAGVGNVFKSEVLFLERTSPLQAATDCDPARVRRLAERAHRLLLANRSSLDRATTGDARPGRRLWVYGRTGRPCRRCRTPIREALVGTPTRVTYWCPVCQAESTSGATP